MAANGPEAADHGPLRAATGFGEGSAAERHPVYQAAPPRAPVLPPALVQREAERDAERRERRATERRSMLRGLILLALVVLFFSLLRAGWDRVFPGGFWRSW